MGILLVSACSAAPTAPEPAFPDIAGPWSGTQLVEAPAGTTPIHNPPTWTLELEQVGPELVGTLILEATVFNAAESLSLEGAFTTPDSGEGEVYGSDGVRIVSWRFLLEEPGNLALNTLGAVIIFERLAASDG